MTEEIIERFFKKECNAEEARQVAAYLKDQPEILNKYLTETEWNNIETAAGKPQEYWDEIWIEIEKKSRVRSAYLLVKRTAVAAIAIGLIIMSYTLFINSDERINQKPKTEIISAFHRIEANTSKKERLILLPDSSEIILSPSSVIEYDIPFKNNKRDILLKGEAYFKVAKDKERPFTVYAGELSATALGTEFKITTRPFRNDITIKLFTGKVVVKSTNIELKGWRKNVYLLPGQQLEYNAAKMLVIVGKIQNTDRLAPAKKPAIATIQKKLVFKDDLSFNSTPLHDVMEQLSKYYHVKIEYSQAELDGMNFTGTITKTDSLHIVLRVITQMNQLQMLQQDNVFIIQKPLVAEKE